MEALRSRTTDAHNGATTTDCKLERVVQGHHGSGGQMLEISMVALRYAGSGMLLVDE